MVYFTKPKVKTDYVLATVNQVHRASSKQFLNAETDEIGIELELEGENLGSAFEKLTATGCDYWKMDRDGSLDATGREFTFTKALSRLDATKALTAFYKVFDKEAVVKVSERCSTHMHLNFQHRSMLQVYSFVTLFSMLERPLFEVFAPERMTSGYCVPSFVSTNHSRRLNASLKKGVLNPTEKYRSLNTGPLGSYGSVECRMLGGSPNAEKPLAWMKILLEIYDYIKANPRLTPQDILDTDDLVGFISTSLPAVYASIKHLEGLGDILAQAAESAYSYAYAVDWKEVKTATPPKSPRKVDPARVNFTEDAFVIPALQEGNIYDNDGHYDDD